MRHYVLTYSGMSDPTLEESAALAAAVGQSNIIDSSPGMFLVTGDPKNLSAILHQHALWTLSQSVPVEVKPPSKSLKAPG